jgi:amidophosphoribosyltransferase
MNGEKAWTAPADMPTQTDVYADIFEIEKPHDECGVFAIYDPGAPVAGVTFRGLQALQHRGQNGAGISVLFEEADHIMTFKGVGMVDAAIPEAVPGSDGRNHIDMLMQSPLAVGHTRYSTGGSAEASQPFTGDFTQLAIAHNGHIEDVADVAEAYGLSTGSPQ